MKRGNGSPSEGIDGNRVQLRRLMDMRYVGQWRSLTVPVSTPLEANLDASLERFHQEHEREYAYLRPRPDGRNLRPARRRSRAGRQTRVSQTGAWRSRRSQDRRTPRLLRRGRRLPRHGHLRPLRPPRRHHLRRPRNRRTNGLDGRRPTRLARRSRDYGNIILRQ